MKKLHQQLFAGERLFEYVLLLPIDELLAKKIKAITKGVETAFSNASIFEEPYISILVFQQFEGLEFRITNCFDKFAQTLEPPSIALKGFQQSSSHTISIELEHTEHILALIGKLKHRFEKLLKFDDIFKPIFNDQPQLCIFDNLDVNQVKLASLIKEPTFFHGFYMANEMLLLKREVDLQSEMPTGKYRPVKHFPFRETTAKKRLTL